MLNSTRGSCEGASKRFGLAPMICARKECEKYSSTASMQKMRSPARIERAQDEFNYAARVVFCFASENTSIRFLLNSGISDGLRLLTQLPSRTQTSSVHFAPAFFR